jgi:hypothetical protein
LNGVDPLTSDPKEIPPASNHRLRFINLLQNRKVVGLSIGFGAYNYVFYLLLTRLPSYLAEALHVDLLHSFFYIGVPWLIATATDLIINHHWLYRQRKPFLHGSLCRS